MPHYYLTLEVSIEKLSSFRKELATIDPNAKITFNDIFIKAVGLASLKFPQARSQWHEDIVREFKQVDVAFAVDTGNGLITPIVPNVPRIGLRNLASITKGLIAKAKENKLAPSEYQVNNSY